MDGLSWSSWPSEQRTMLEQSSRNTVVKRSVSRVNFDVALQQRGLRESLRLAQAGNIANMIRHVPHLTRCAADDMTMRSHSMIRCAASCPCILFMSVVLQRHRRCLDFSRRDRDLHVLHRYHNHCSLQFEIGSLESMWPYPSRNQVLCGSGLRPWCSSCFACCQLQLQSTGPVQQD